MKIKLALTLLLFILFGSTIAQGLDINLEEEKDIISIKLMEETVISPNNQKLTVEISKPWTSTPKEFELNLTILGPAIFEDNTKQNSLSIDTISKDQKLEKIIKIENSASGTGDIINLNYDFRYKSSSWGRIDENFKVFYGSLSFKGAASNKAECEEELKICKENKESLSDEIVKLNEDKSTLQDEINSINYNLTKCQTSLSSQNKECKTIDIFGWNVSCFLLLVGLILSLILWLMERRRNKRHVPHRGFD